MKRLIPILLCSVWLLAQPAVKVTAIQRNSTFTTASQTYVLPQIPVFPHVQVFYNGMLMLEGLDYTVSGATINFLVTVSPDPIIQVIYFAI